MATIDQSLFYSTSPQLSAVERVVEHFQELLLQRKIRPGNLLPSESVLAERLGVSRGSLREAMKVLSALGLVEIKRGNGTYVCHDLGRGLLDPFLLRLNLLDYGIEQLMEFRMLIEMDVVRSILKHPNPEGLCGMATSLEHMAALDPAHAESAWELDMAFHHAMAQASGNVLIQQLYTSLLRFFEPMIQKTYQVPGNREMALQLHQAIYDALVAGDEQAATQAVANAIDGWIKGGE